MSVVHHVPGRLRVCSAAVRRNGEMAAAVERALATSPGVTGVEAKTLTGSIVIYYDPSATTPPALLDALRGLGALSQAACLPARQPTRARRPLSRRIGSRIARRAATEIVDIAVSRSVAALVAAIL